MTVQIMISKISSISKNAFEHQSCCPIIFSVMAENRQRVENKQFKKFG